MTTQAIEDQIQYIADQQKKLCEMAEAEYPVGSRLIVHLGGNQITVEVTGHNDCYWSNPGQIISHNIHTGAVRKFMPGDVLTKL